MHTRTQSLFISQAASPQAGDLNHSTSIFLVCITAIIITSTNSYYGGEMKQCT